MPEMEPLQAYRAIEVPVDFGGPKPELLRVPFDVDLLERIEETARKALNQPWYVLRRREERVVETYQEFCRPYFPEGVNYRKLDPTLCALFFSHVRSESLRSIDACVKRMNSTAGRPEPTAERTTAGPPSA